MYKKVLVMLLTVISFSACENMQYAEEQHIIQYLPKLTTIVYDSCEYIVGADSYSAVLTHKGNCKYCKQRREEEKNVDEFKQHVKNILMELDKQ